MLDLDELLSVCAADWPWCVQPVRRPSELSITSDYDSVRRNFSRRLKKTKQHPSSPYLLSFYRLAFFSPLFFAVHLKDNCTSSNKYQSAGTGYWTRTLNATQRKAEKQKSQNEKEGGRKSKEAQSTRFDSYRWLPLQRIFFFTAVVTSQLKAENVSTLILHMETLHSYLYITRRYIRSKRNEPRRGGEKKIGAWVCRQQGFSTFKKTGNIYSSPELSSGKRKGKNHGYTVDRHTDQQQQQRNRGENIQVWSRKWKTRSRDKMDL